MFPPSTAEITAEPGAAVVKRFQSILRQLFQPPITRGQTLGREVDDAATRLMARNEFAFSSSAAAGCLVTRRAVILD